MPIEKSQQAGIVHRVALSPSSRILQAGGPANVVDHREQEQIGRGNQRTKCHGEGQFFELVMTCQVKKSLKRSNSA